MTNVLVKLFIKNSEDVQNIEVRSKYGLFAGVVGICINVILFCAKLMVGFWSSSIAITTDAINNIIDASASGITLVGFKLSKMPADKEHPYGHARYEYIAGLCVAVLILVIGIESGKTSIDKILNPRPVTIHGYTIAVLLGSVFAKWWLMVFNRSLGKKIESSVLLATAVDSRNDMVSTGMVLVGTVLGVWFDVNLDGVFGLIVSFVILHSGFGIVGDTLSLLLGERPNSELTREINEKILTYTGVLGVHDLIVHDYGPGHRFASVHVEMDATAPPLECHEIIDTIEREFAEENIVDLVIHYDPIDMGDSETALLRQKVERIIKSFSEVLSLHDFRIVKGEANCNLIFDLVIPRDCEHKEDEILAYIKGALSQYDMKYTLVITFDHSY